MRDRIINKWFLSIRDRYTGTNIVEVKKELEVSQWWDMKRIEDLQTRKMRFLIHYAYENVPYYHELFRKNGLKPNDVRTLDDIKKVPVTTKEDLKDHPPEQLRSKYFTDFRIKMGNTGGTTGNPLRIVRDQWARSQAYASMYRWYGWMGLEVGDPILRIWGAPIFSSGPRKLIRTMSHQFVNEYHLNAFDLSSEKLRDQLRLIIHMKPKGIHGYAMGVHNFAKFVRETDGIELDPVSISITAEVISKEQREFIEDVFGCRTFDQYGCGECNGIAFECDHHQGLHINAEHCVLELSNGNSGDVIITNLDNFVMPFIRYKNGDLATSSRDPCDCGRKMPLLASIDGRKGDAVVIRGGNVHAEYFTHLLHECGWNRKYHVEKFQIVQRSTSDIEWNIVVGVNPEEKAISEMKAILISTFKDVRFEFNFVEDIPPEKGGKYRYVKSYI